MSWEDVCHFLAQCAINIDYAEVEKDPAKKVELMTIHPNSKIHKSLHAFCEYVNTEQVKYMPVRIVKK